MLRSFAKALSLMLLFQSGVAHSAIVAEGPMRLPGFDKWQVSLWIPKDVQISDSTRLLFMHDGQMLFDAATTWNKQAWEVDETLNRLLTEGKLSNVVVVAIDNRGGDERRRDFFPQRAAGLIKDDAVFDTHPHLDASKGLLGADEYLAFIIHQLKPYLSQHFGLNPTGANSYLMGSSMGGLISLYGLLEYPDEFSGAGCLSTHWPGSLPEKNTEAIFAALLEWLDLSLNKLTPSHKLYFDYGDQTLDALYPPLQKRVDVYLEDAIAEGAKIESVFFPGHTHEERFWAARLDRPLLFLLGND